MMVSDTDDAAVTVLPVARRVTADGESESGLAALPKEIKQEVELIDKSEPREQLKHEITSLFEDYVFPSTQQPPFSASELIVYAMLISEERDIKASQIISLITTKFPYYSQKVVTNMVEATKYDSIGHASGRHMQQRIPALVFDGFDRALEDYDMPLISKRQDHVVFYTLETHQTRMFIDQHFALARQGTFSFLELPAEIRNEIYEYVLTLSDPRGCVVNTVDGSLSRNTRLKSRTRSNGSTKYGEDSADVGDSRSGLFLLPTLREILAITNTCTQIRKESGSLFWSCNMFTFSLQAVVRFFESMPTSFCRRLEFHDVRIGGGGLSESIHRRTRAFRALWTLKKLKSLELSVSDIQWLRDPDERCMKPMNRLPESTFLAMAAFNAERYDIKGQCPLLKKYVQNEVQRLKSAKSAEDKATAKKQTKDQERKATNEVLGTDLRRSKRIMARPACLS